MFIVFEGIDGSGKTTQAEMLSRKFLSLGIPFILTREPSDGIIGQKLRKLKYRLSPEEESRLFLEDRLDHIRTVIGPALRDRKHVLCDRYFHSSAAYQGAKGLDPQKILRENLSEALVPDIVFIIEVSVLTALNRIAESRQDGFSVFENAQDLEKVDRIYKVFKDSFIRRIDGEKSASKIHCEVVGHLKNKGLTICCG